MQDTPACHRAASLAILALPPGAALDGDVAVTDGDSLKIDGERIQLYGIDTPKPRKRCEQRGQIDKVQALGS